ncbi:acyltransferase [Halobacillus fulvus]|nr:acyltransferase [Halobacillus fulvus]
MSKQRIDSIYFLRIFAMLMVVLVHVSAAYATVPEVGTTTHTFFHFINRVIRIEYGIFIMLTAMVFFYKYKDQPMDGQELKRYYKKRVVFIVVPYLFWALFYEAFSLYVGVVSFDLSEIALRILQGESFYQLYFIFLIVQLYLIFPALLYVIKRSSFLKKYLWLIGILIEIGYYFFSREVASVPFRIFIGSLGPYLLGAWLGIHYLEQRKKSFHKSTISWGISTVIFGGLFVFLHYQLYIANSFTLPGYVFLLVELTYMLGGSYFLFRLAEVLSVKWARSIPYIQNVALYSFGFYLLHPFVLRVVAEFIPVPNSYWFSVGVGLRFIATITLCYLIIYLTHKYFPYPGLIFGKLPSKARFITKKDTPQPSYKKVGT